MEIQFLNLHKSYLELKTELDQLWQDLNNDNIYILGPRLEKFEKEFAQYLGVSHVIGVADGLDALTLALRALDIGDGDEVIVPAHTYIASWLAVSETRAKPVPVEADSTTYLLDCTKIKQAITNKTRAIMPVHLYGRICDMEGIAAIAKEYDLKIIEDAAQAHGAVDIATGKKAGSFGDCAGFSFYPGKNLGCFGDGGCISTNNDVLAEKIRMLRDYGRKTRYHHEVLGINSRLDELQAGILSIKLKYLDKSNKKRQDIAKCYLKELSGIKDLALPEYDEGSCWYVFPIRTKRRKELIEYLASNKIGTGVYYPTPIHMQPAYQFMNLKQGAFPITEQICAEVLSLPIDHHLTEEEMMFCTRKVREFFSNQ